MCDFVVVAFFCFFLVVAVCVRAYVRACVLVCVCCCCFYQKYIYLDKILLYIVVRLLSFMFMQVVFSQVHLACHNIANSIKQ